MATFEEFLNERNITLKRRYTEAHPAKMVGSSAKVRNAIIEALKDGKITVAEFNDIVAQYSSAPAKWTRGNKRFFKIEEDGVSLSKYGQKILTSLVTESVNESVNEARYDKKKLLKRLGDADDATIQTGDGKEYIIYNPDSNNDDNAAMWHDKSVFAVDQDGEEHEIAYKDIGLVMTESVNEAKYDKKKLLKRISDVTDALIQTKDGKEYTIFNPEDFDTPWNDKTVFATDEDGEEHEIDYTDIKSVMVESVNEARVSAKKLLKSVVNGETNSVEGIKLSKGMAQAFSDWLENSTYGRKFSKLPWDALFTAAFNWGIERYAKSGELKGELKDLKIKAKAMKESKIYESFSEFIAEGKDKWVVYDTETKKILPNAGKIFKTLKAAEEFAAKQKNAEVASDIFYHDRIKEANEVNEKSMKDWFLANIDSFKDEKEYMKAGKKAGFSKKELEAAMDNFEQGGEDYLESNEVTEGLNKSDVSYQLAIDYTGRTKPKITKLNKKRIQIKYGYKISPQKVIDSIKTVHPEVELKHVEWSNSMSGGGFHIFDILEANEASAEYVNKDAYNFKVGDIVGNTIDGFEFKVLKFVGAGMILVKNIRTGRKFKAYKQNFYLAESYLKEAFKLDESFTAKLTGIARTAKNVEDFIKKVFKHEKFKAFDTPKTQKDSYEKFLNFIKSHYAMVQQYESNNIKENTIYTKFTDFVNESLEVNEALKSSKLRGLLTMNKANKNLLKAIYGFSKIALDKIEDHQIQDIDPKTGKKAEGLVVYYTTQEKENPYADNRNYNSGVNIPANTILAMGMGKDVAYVEGIFDRKTRKMSYTLTTNPKRAKSDIGINKEYRGWNASGIYNVKRVIDIADAAFVINPKALPDTDLTTYNRAKAKEGAVAFKSDKEFKAANLQRYEEILQKRASTMDIDKLVEDAINDMAEMMKDAIKNKQKNKYGEIIAGVGEDGRAYKINDISNFTSNLLRDYERWAGYMATISAKEDLPGQKDLDWEIRYATRESKKYAKEIRDRLAKLKKRNIAW